MAGLPPLHHPHQGLAPGQRAAPCASLLTGDPREKLGGAQGTCTCAAGRCGQRGAHLPAGPQVPRLVTPLQCPHRTGPLQGTPKQQHSWPGAAGLPGGSRTRGHQASPQLRHEAEQRGRGCHLKAPGPPASESPATLVTRPFDQGPWGTDGGKLHGLRDSTDWALTQALSSSGWDPVSPCLPTWGTGNHGREAGHTTPSQALLLGHPILVFILPLGRNGT